MAEENNPITVAPIGFDHNALNAMYDEAGWQQPQTWMLANEHFTKVTASEAKLANEMKSTKVAIAAQPSVASDPAPAAKATSRQGDPAPELTLDWPVSQDKPTTIVTDKDWSKGGVDDLMTYIRLGVETGKVIEVALNKLDNRLYVKDKHGMFTVPITDDIELDIIHSLELATGRGVIPDAKYPKILKLMGKLNKFNPIEQFVANLPVWAGKDQAQQFLANIWSLDAAHGLGPISVQYYEVASALMLLAVALRARDTSEYVKQDAMYVFTGRAGIRKSTFIAKLLPSKYESLTDDIATLDNKDDDNLALLSTTLVNEIAEMSSINGRSVDRVKALLSQRKLTFRVPYAHNSVTLFMHNLLIASTNNGSTLNDLTGNRKFIMVDVYEEAKTELMTDEYLEQLYAEVLYKYDHEWDKPMLTIESIAAALGYNAKEIAKEADAMRGQHSLYNPIQDVITNVVNGTPDDALDGLSAHIMDGVKKSVVVLDENGEVVGINTSQLRTAIDTTTAGESDAVSVDMREAIGAKRAYSVEAGKVAESLGFIEEAKSLSISKLGIVSERKWYFKPDFIKKYR